MNWVVFPHPGIEPPENSRVCIPIVMCPCLCKTVCNYRCYSLDKMP